MSATPIHDALTWWEEAFGGEPYTSLTSADLIRNLAIRGGDFARVVRVLEEQMPRPDRDVLDACDTRLAEVAT